MSALSWFVTAAVLTCAYPWARLAVPEADSPWLVLVTTLGLSLGVLTLGMLGFALFGIPLDWRLDAGLCALVAASGFFLTVRRNGRFIALPQGQRNAEGSHAYEAPLTGIWRVIALLTATIAALIVFNAIYWPFGIDDSVAIYAWYGKLITQSRLLPPLVPGSLYEAYPMLLPLSYAFTHQASGWMNEYLAAAIPGLMSVGAMVTAYLLGRAVYNKRAGLLAALLCALTPAFAFWAGASYADLPCGFFYSLSAVFLFRASQRDRARDWLLAGILAGLAAWTKNSGLLITGSSAFWMVYSGFMHRMPFRRWAVRVLLVAASFLLITGPWYGRNLILSGVLIPATGWTYAAQRTVGNLFPYLVGSRYLPTGILLTAGVGAMIFALSRRQTTTDERKGALFLLAFFGPFFAVWWLLFSYDPRFLLVVFPFIAVMGARFTLALVAWVRPLLSGLAPRLRSPAARLLGTAMLIALALPAASAAVDHKVEMLRRPLMSDYDKHVVRLGDRYPLALYLRDTLPGTHIWTQDQLLPYHASGVDMFVGPLPKPSDLIGYDYWVASPGNLVPGWIDQTPVFSNGAYRLYRVPRPTN